MSIIRDEQRETASLTEAVPPIPGRSLRRRVRALARNRGVQAALLLALVIAGAAAVRAGSSRPVAPTPATSVPSSSVAPVDAAAAAARAKAKAAPMATSTSSATAGTTPVSVVTLGSLPVNHRTVRVVSARTDLSSFRELAWRADAGRAVGDARCTQSFRFNSSMPPGERPTTLLCWRVGAGKSVYTLSVNLDEHPSEAESVALLDRAWNELG